MNYLSTDLKENVRIEDEDVNVCNGTVHGTLDENLIGGIHLDCPSKSFQGKYRANFSLGGSMCCLLQ